MKGNSFSCLWLGYGGPGSTLTGSGTLGPEVISYYNIIVKGLKKTGLNKDTIGIHIC